MAGAAQALEAVATHPVRIGIDIPVDTSRGPFLIDLGVAVVVDAIANLNRFGMDGRTAIIAVAVYRSGKRELRCTQTGTVQADTVTILVAVRVVGNAQQGARFIDITITVIVGAVTKLLSHGEDVPVEGRAIFMIGKTVIVVIRVNAVRQAVPISVGSITAQGGVKGTGVFIVGQTIAVDIVVNAVGLTIIVHIFKAFVNETVAVIVNAVTVLVSPGENGLVVVVAIAAGQHIPGQVVTKAGRLITAKPITIAITRVIHTPLSIGLINFTVTVIVLAVAHLGADTGLITIR
jgi:hypothetical protein